MVTFPGCLRFFIDKEIAFVTSDKIKILSDDLKAGFECPIDSAELIRMNEKELIVLDAEGHGYRIDLVKQEISSSLTTPDILFQRSSYGAFIPVYKFTSIYDPFEYGMFNIEKNEVIWMNPTCQANQFVQQYFLGIHNNEIHRANHQNGETVWVFPLRTYPPYKDSFGNMQQVAFDKLIGVYQNDLWVKLSDESFLIIDINTGEEMLHITGLASQLGYDVLHTGSFLMDHKAGKLIFLAFTCFLQIDLATRKVVSLKKFDKDWNIAHCQFYPGDSRCYFTGNLGMPAKSIGNLSVGILNTETVEIEWHYSLPDEDRYYSFIGQPQANGRFLGVKDSRNNLHVFNR